MKSQIIEDLEVNGKKIIFRYPKISDSKPAMEFYNKSIKENLDAGGRLNDLKPVSAEKERKWLEEIIRKIKNKEALQIFAECESKIIGSSGISISRNSAKSHAGDFGITILEEFTGKGLGTKLMNKTIEIGTADLGIEMVVLHVFSKNKRAINLYKKMGFKEAGRIKNGIKVGVKYQDDITMVKYL